MISWVIDESKPNKEPKPQESPPRPPDITPLIFLLPDLGDITDDREECTVMYCTVGQCTMRITVYCNALNYNTGWWNAVH